ncbi:DnaD domain protein [Ligilactobacillus animalis]|uniref:DnaD domain protein n=1 Tax=Ligilactobacillus animalis TaxID=1605 RepID=UPI0026DF2024|nr:DnaD domain protein [Ligilactobacillus animalis]MDO5883882.1 DnaD domain protein [Ligilactobacillus animalis]
MEFPSYYSILTADIRYDPRLKNHADCKVLYSEITALSNKYGYCSASNKYFSKLYDRPVPTISKWINILKDLGYLKVEMIYKDNTKEIKERHIFPISTPINANVNTYSRKHEGGINASVKPPINVNVKDNNTSINNTSKNINNNTKQQADASNAFTAFQMSGATLNGFTTPQLVEYVENLGDELVRHAIEYMSNSAPKPSFNYLKRILDSYENAGITTIEQAVKMEDGFRKRREQRRQSNSYTNSKPAMERDLSNKHYGTDEELEAEFFGEA